MKWGIKYDVVICTCLFFGFLIGLVSGLFLTLNGADETIQRLQARAEAAEARQARMEMKGCTVD